MRRIVYSLLVSITIFSQYGFCEKVGGPPLSSDSIKGTADSDIRKQELYNGRVWRNIDSRRVTGNQFLFTREFLPGSVTMNGKLFTGLSLRYDTYNDELLVIKDSMTILQLNKELVNMFTLTYENVSHKFIKAETDSVNTLNGYLDILYEGRTSLYVKSISEISRLAQGRTYDVFISEQRIYIKKENIFYNIKRKKDLLNLLNDKDQQIRHYLKSNRIRVSKKNPASYIPAIMYYDHNLQ